MAFVPKIATEEDLEIEDQMIQDFVESLDNILIVTTWDALRHTPVMLWSKKPQVTITVYDDESQDPSYCDWK